MAPDAPSRPDVFLSYAREDEARAHELAAALDQHGFSVFWDREIPPGQTWHSHIGEALAHARCVVVAWSRHSIASQWVLEEASEGRDRRVLVPVLLEAVQPPFGFRAIHAASLIGWCPGRSSPAFDGLVGAVRRIVGQGLSDAPQASPGSYPPKERPEIGRTSIEGATLDQVLKYDPRSARIVHAIESAPRSAPRLSAPKFAPAIRPLVLLIVVGLLAIAGAAFFWWLTQPATDPTVGRVAPRQPVAEPKPSEPSLEPAPAAAPEETSAASTGTVEPGEVMRDCPECPEMVLVPADEFTMGSPSGELGRDDDEGPQRTVTIAEPFWVGKYEVTFAEWDACVAAGGCSTKPGDAGSGRDNRPVIAVSWHDSKEYVGWLSRRTGKIYRLLSEAEWEYAARAGSTTAFWWGDEVGRGNANCAGCDSEWDQTRTVPVGSFKPNDFGLYDTAGNVWEWVEDCWNDSYDGAPLDGSSWLEGDCSLRVLRGGSWSLGPIYVRSAERSWVDPDGASGIEGFRVARAPD